MKTCNQQYNHSDHWETYAKLYGFKVEKYDGSMIAVDDQGHKKGVWEDDIVGKPKSGFGWFL